MFARNNNTHKKNYVETLEENRSFERDVTSGTEKKRVIERGRCENNRAVKRDINRSAR
jgi:hypothetical protein